MEGLSDIPGSAGSCLVRHFYKQLRFPGRRLVGEQQKSLQNLKDILKTSSGIL
jgi:hypothetical protein